LSKSLELKRHRHVGASGFGVTVMEDAMQYMLLIYSDESARQNTSEAEMGQVIAAYMAYSEAVSKAGILVASDRLRPIATATTVRITDGKTQVLNGPYAETREQLGGYYLIDVPDLDAALSWAARCPGAAQGSVEVRPVWQM
jgi:hypothetical protein